MDGAAAEILATHGEKSMQAISAGFNVMCPELGGIVIGNSSDTSGNAGRGIWTAEAVGQVIEVVEKADLSCDEAKAGFRIHIYLLPNFDQVT